MGDLSLQKLSANRKNAQLSTGPKTALGKPKDQMQAILCDKVTIDIWRLRKVLAFEQGASQLETLNLDTSDSPVDLSRREVLVGHLESYKSELKNLNQLKNLINNGALNSLSEISGEIYELLFEVIQSVKQRFPEIYEKVEIDYLHECENLRDFCEQNDIEIETFKQDLLDRIENKLRSGSNMPNYYENGIKEFDHKKKLIAAICAAPSLLGKLGLFKNLEFTCYPSCEEGIDGIYTAKGVEIHKNYITAKSMAYTVDFALEIVSYLLGEKAKVAVSNAIYAKK